MSGAFVKIDLHGLRQEEAMKVIDRAIASAGPATYQRQLIHGYNRGARGPVDLGFAPTEAERRPSLRSMIFDCYRYEPKVKRIIPGDNPGITVLVLKELY